MDRLLIGVWQGVCKDGDVEANLARTEQVIDEAARAGCRFVCLPEQFLSGSGDRQMHLRCAMRLDDPRLADLARRAGDRGVIALVGLDEQRGEKVANTQVILAEGRVVGHYTKTMLTGGDRQVMDFYDDELPVFELGGVRFGVIICHDSSFAEVGATMAWKGARVLFSPHFNSIARERMDEHRILVRNNHVGLAAHYHLIVARANAVGYWPEGDRLGYGDSAIFGPYGAPLAEAGLFAERLVTADVAGHLGPPRWRDRRALRPAIIRQLAAAALEALGEGQAPQA